MMVSSYALPQLTVRGPDFGHSWKNIRCVLGADRFETSDGDIRRLAAGSIVLAEDRTGKGHISRHPAEGQLVVHVDLCRPV